MPFFYLVSRCRKDDSLYGPLHGTWDADKTLCDHEIDGEHWWILHTDGDGMKVTCKRCLKEMAKEDQP